MVVTDEGIVTDVRYVFSKAEKPIDRTRLPRVTDVMLPNPGDYHYRHGGEAHYNSPAAMAELQVAARTNSRKAYAAYARTIIEQSRAVSIRGLLQFRQGRHQGLGHVLAAEPSKASVDSGAHRRLQAGWIRSTGVGQGAGHGSTVERGFSVSRRSHDAVGRRR